MSQQQKNDIIKSRGRPATGKGTPVLVRVSDDLLSVIDKIAVEGGFTRPQTLRHALSEWAEAHGLIKGLKKSKERPVVISLDVQTIETINGILAEFPDANDLQDAVEDIVTDWLRYKGYLPK